MTWIAASENPLKTILAGPFPVISEIDARPIIPFLATGNIQSLANLTIALNNPLSADFIKVIEAGRPVDTGGSGSIRPTSGLIYPRRI